MEHDIVFEENRCNERALPNDQSDDGSVQGADPLLELALSIMNYLAVNDIFEEYDVYSNGQCIVEGMCRISASATQAEIGIVKQLIDVVGLVLKETSIDGKIAIQLESRIFECKVALRDDTRVC